MFRNDRLTVKREVYEVINGGISNRELETVAENIPCHLSVNLTPVVKSYNVPYLMSDFILFASSNLSVRTNDILIITTEKGQKYELFAGEIKIYGLTIQIKCTQEKVTEKNDTGRY